MKRLTTFLILTLYSLCNIAQSYDNNDFCTADITTIMDAANRYVDGFSKQYATRQAFLLYPGYLEYVFSNVPEYELQMVDTLKICGPVNGADIRALHTIVGEGSKYPNIRHLDMSRAWVISDSVMYNGFINDMTRQFFDNLKGIRSEISITEDLKTMFGELAEILNGKDKLRLLHDEFGYVIEIIPDTLYVSYMTTIKDCVTRSMFSEMPYVECIRLPESTTAIHSMAIANCPSLREVVIPKNVMFVEEGAFAYDSLLEVVHIHDESQLPYSDSFNMQDKEHCAFYECSDKFHIEKYTIPVPSEVSAEKMKQYSDTLTELQRQIRDDSRKLSYEWRSDSIIAKSGLILEKKKEMVQLICKVYDDNEDNTLAAQLINKHFDEIDINMLQFMLAHMNDRNSLDSSTEDAWNKLYARSEVEDVDWMELADTTSMTKVCVTIPGTLRSLLSKEEWTEVRKLYVSGKLNRDDLRWLRDLSSTIHSSVENPILNTIDMSEVSMTTLPDSAFFATDMLLCVRLPLSLKTIGNRAFAMSLLHKVVMPQGLQRICSMAFDCCLKLRSADIPDNVTVIEDGAFSVCSRLRYVHLPEKLDTMGIYVFSQSPFLRELTIPASLRYLEASYFPGCPELTLNVDSANAYYKIVENCIVGKTEASRHQLKQYVQKKYETPKLDGDIIRLPKNAIGRRSTYKMVNGKKVLVKRTLIY